MLTYVVLVQKFSTAGSYYVWERLYLDTCNGELKIPNSGSIIPQNKYRYLNT